MEGKKMAVNFKEEQTKTSNLGDPREKNGARTSGKFLPAGQVVIIM